MQNAAHPIAVAGIQHSIHLSREVNMERALPVDASLVVHACSHFFVLCLHFDMQSEAEAEPYPELILEVHKHAQSRIVRRGLLSPKLNARIAAWPV
jgi:hypothetical protein